MQDGEGRCPLPIYPWRKHISADFPQIKKTIVESKPQFGCFLKLKHLFSQWFSPLKIKRTNNLGDFGVPHFRKHLSYSIISHHNPNTPSSSVKIPIQYDHYCQCWWCLLHHCQSLSLSFAILSVFLVLLSSSLLFLNHDYHHYHNEHQLTMAITMAIEPIHWTHPL